MTNWYSITTVGGQRNYGVAMRTIERSGPRFSDHLHPTVSGHAGAKGSTMTRERILVVDDEEDLLELVNYNLSKEGYRVRCVATGEEALAEARQSLPDLIVLDLLLPAVDGLEVCRRLQVA